MRDTLILMVILYFLITNIFFACYLPVVNKAEDEFMLIILGLLLGWILFPIKVIVNIFKLFKGEIKW